MMFGECPTSLPPVYADLSLGLHLDLEDRGVMFLKNVGL
jgi:hypothetical protein